MLSTQRVLFGVYIIATSFCVRWGHWGGARQDVSKWHSIVHFAIHMDRQMKQSKDDCWVENIENVPILFTKENPPLINPMPEEMHHYNTLYFNYLITNGFDYLGVFKKQTLTQSESLCFQTYIKSRGNRMSLI